MQDIPLGMLMEVSLKSKAFWIEYHCIYFCIKQEFNIQLISIDKYTESVHGKMLNDQADN